ncbi:hypothetical protein BH23ACT11_BH23ACT11_11130 [soil metagenome]
MRDDEQHPRLVVVGSSAGGIEALSVLVSSLPEDFPAPVVIAQHLDPRRESHLGEILARKSTLPVRTVTEREPLEPGVVFVVPSNREVNITDSAIDLRMGGSGQPRPSIDRLLKSAAEVVAEGLIAVILTGTGSDGASGAGAVKKAGGTVVIQNPETAEYPGMPMSLAPNTVDIVAELDDIGQMLYDLVVGDVIVDAPDEDETLQSLLTTVRDQHGIDFSSYKTPTILRRLQRRIVATRTENLREYSGHLREHPEEYQQLISSFLINVTNFFRDAALFEYLKTDVLPALIDEARSQDKQLRLWSAGCSTGEEPYSLALLVAEALGDELGQFDVRIFATDLDEEAIEFARHGIYSRSALEDVPQDMINRYFVRETGEFEINKQVRGMIVFGEHDLALRAPFPRIDLVVCRNVLIYFTPELQKRTLQLFAYSLRNEGRLVLGQAETISPLPQFFQQDHDQLKVFKRRGDRFLMPPALLATPSPLSRSTSRPRHPTRDLQPRADPGRDRERAEQLIENYVLGLSMGVVVVDRQYDIQTINNAARQLLAVHSPASGEDLLHLIQGPEAYETLRSAIDTAFREKIAVNVGELPVEEPGISEPRHLRLTIQPRKDEGGRKVQETVIIFITDATDLVRSRDELTEQRDHGNSEFERVGGEGEAEIDRQRSHAQRLEQANQRLTYGNRELSIINEELQGSNEELLLSTEESQAATEEIETLNEELQATNEVLETLNEELQATIEELTTTNVDLQARTRQLQELSQVNEDELSALLDILNSMDNAVLIVDSEGVLSFNNAAYRRMFGEDDVQLLNEAGQSMPEEDLPWSRALRGESFVTRFTDRPDGDERRWFEATGQKFYRKDTGQFGAIVILRELDTPE